MGKLTLIEKMERRDDIPQSWISEVGSMLRTIERQKDRVQEYEAIIDTLARREEWLEIENASMNKRIAEYEDLAP